MVFTKLISNVQTFLPKRNVASSVAMDLDQIDLISYEGLAEQSDHAVLDGRYVRTLYISGFPYVAVSGWLSNLARFSSDIDIAHHIEVVPAEYAVQKLSRKITELESTRRSMIRAGKIIGSELTDPLDSAVSLKEKIMRGEEKLFQISIYITVFEESLDELNMVTKLLESELATRMFYTKTARYQQLDGIQSILPRGQDVLAQKRNLDSSSAALTFPLTSSELVHENGILYGVNTSNNSLVILDRFALNNANSIVFAQSGSGKSYATKVEILRQLMHGTRVIVIDPEREYEQICQSTNGSYITLSTSSESKINPFDLALTARSRSKLSDHVQDLTEIISLMADGLNASERAAVDKALTLVYAEFVDATPRLQDLYAQLHKQGYLVLCERLEKYITGSLAGVFNEHTNIDLSNRFVVFDIKDMPESLREIMMMIIGTFVQQEIKTVFARRMLIIDEAWILLQHEQSARFMTSLVRRARKYYLGVSIISQQASDFLSHDLGRVIASQSSLRILMRQDTTTIKHVASEFNLSDWEQNYLLTCGRGEAIIIADSTHVALQIVASAQEHPLITTNPLEKDI